MFITARGIDNYLSTTHVTCVAVPFSRRFIAGVSVNVILDLNELYVAPLTICAIRQELDHAASLPANPNINELSIPVGSLFGLVRQDDRTSCCTA